mgnify:CR=1 FL=1
MRVGVTMRMIVRVLMAVTMVVPNGNTEPLAGTYTVVSTAQLSLVMAEKDTTASHCPGSVACSMSGGQEIVGTSSSVMVTVKVHEAVRPLTSVTVAVTMVLPTGKADPLAGTYITLATPQLSETVAVKLTFR